MASLPEGRGWLRNSSCSERIEAAEALRELVVGGIVRPEDIESDNTLESTKIAQARIAYGGRGQITDVQQPRYGQQMLDIILPW